MPGKTRHWMYLTLAIAGVFAFYKLFFAHGKLDGGQKGMASLWLTETSRQKVQGMSICGLQPGTQVSAILKELPKFYKIDSDGFGEPVIVEQKFQGIVALDLKVDTIKRIRALSKDASVEQNGQVLFYSGSPWDRIIHVLKRFDTFERTGSRITVSDSKFRLYVEWDGFINTFTLAPLD